MSDMPNEDELEDALLAASVEQRLRSSRRTSEYPDYPLSMMPRLMWSAVFVFESDVQNVGIFLTRAGATAAVLEDIADSGWEVDDIETHLDTEQLPDHWIADGGTVEWHVFSAAPKP